MSAHSYPQKYHLDLSLGCQGLLEEVWRVKPKLHVFGHVHWGHGREPIYFDECQRAYESVMTARQASRWGNYGILSDVLFLLFEGGWRDTWLVLWHGVNSILWKWVMLGPGSNNGGLMVNAAVTYGNTGKVKNKVLVVDL